MNEFRLAQIGTIPLQIIDGDRGLNYPKKIEFRDHGHCLFLSTNNVTSSGFNFGETVFISRQRDELLRKGKAQRDDIVLTTRGTVGNVALYDGSVPFDHIRINSGMVLLRVDPKKIDPRFFYAFLRSPSFHKQVVSNGSGSAQPQLPISALQNIVLPLPSIEEQRKIATILSALDGKIDLNNRINAELEALAKTIYDYWFVQFDFPDANGRPYKSSGGAMVWNESLKREIPAGWKAGSLDDLGQIVGGSTPSTSNPDHFGKNMIPWITPKDLSNNKGNKFIARGETDVSEVGKRSASLTLYPAGTVLMSSRAPVGYLAIALNPVTTNQGFKSFIPTKGYGTSFVYYAVARSLPTIIQYASGSTFVEISGSVLKSVHAVLPNKPVSGVFCSKIEPIVKRQQQAELENVELTQLRDWLLPLLMNGQVRVG
jgi:type I restriction enzyme S subunit